MDTKIIKGQAWIEGNNLVQEQITFTATGHDSCETVILVENIWDDLTKENHLYKVGKPGYYYWDYKMTDTEDDTIEKDIMFECPKPKFDLFSEPYDPETVNGEYAKYWVQKLKTTQENMDKCSSIQRKEILFAGTSYTDQKGDIITIEDTVENNTDLGDITNLLSLF